jgi:hypothetical protein
MCIYLAPLKRAPTAQVGQTCFFFFFVEGRRYRSSTHGRTSGVVFRIDLRIMVAAGALQDKEEPSPTEGSG